jgi:uncharacterized protein YpmB
MDTPKKGNGPIVIIFLLIIVIVGFFVYKSSMTKTTKSVTTETQVPSAVAIDADLKAVDANTTGLSQDTSAIDAGLNDTPIEQPE